MPPLLELALCSPPALPDEVPSVLGDVVPLSSGAAGPAAEVDAGGSDVADDVVEPGATLLEPDVDALVIAGESEFEEAAETPSAAVLESVPHATKRTARQEQ